MSKSKEIIALNSVLKNKKIKSDEYRNLIQKDEDSAAYLIPESIKSDIEKRKLHNKSLRDYVHVIPVETEIGTYSDEDESNISSRLVNLENANKEVSEQELKLKGVRWELQGYGSFTPIDENFYEDTSFDLVKFFTNAHGEKAAKTENELIFSALEESLEAKKLSGIDALGTSLDKDLNPALEKEIVIVTNQNGLKELKKSPEYQVIKKGDRLERYLDVYKIEIYSNDDLPDVENEDNTTSIPVIYGALKRGIKLFELSKINVRFIKNPFGLRVMKHIIRGIEYLDVKVIPDTKQVIYGKITLEQGVE